MTTETHTATASELYARAVERHLADDLDGALQLYDKVDALRPNYDDESFNTLIGRTLTREMNRPAQEHISCQYIEKGIHAGKEGLDFCCIQAPGGGRPRIANYSGGRVPVDIVIAKRERLRRLIAHGEPNACSGCSYLKRGHWKEDRDRFLRFLILDNHAACNARCIYCWVPEYYAQRLPMYPYRFGGAFKWLQEEQLLSDRMVVIWSGGEPTLSKDFNAITRSVLDVPEAHVVFLTSALLHSELISEALREKRCVILISVDAGTSETYARIKFGQEKPWTIQGEDTFDVIWRVLGRYTQINNASGGGAQTVCVKYIFMEGNTSTKDVDGFFERCVKIGVRCVGLALADEFASKAAPESVLSAGALFMRRAAECNLLLQTHGIGPHLEEIEARFVDFGIPMPVLYPEEEPRAKLERETKMRQNGCMRALRDFERIEEMTSALSAEVWPVVLQLKARLSAQLLASNAALVQVSQKLLARDEELAQVSQKLLAKEEELALASQKLLASAEQLDRQRGDSQNALRALGEKVDGTQREVTALTRSRALRLTRFISGRPLRQLSKVAAKVTELSGAVQQLDQESHS